MALRTADGSKGQPREGTPQLFSEATRREIDTRRCRHHGTMTHDYKRHGTDDVGRRVLNVLTRKVISHKPRASSTSGIPVFRYSRFRSIVRS